MSEDSGYELSDSKHPTYHDRMADVWDNRDKVDALIGQILGECACPKCTAIAEYEGYCVRCYANPDCK